MSTQLIVGRIAKYDNMAEHSYEVTEELIRKYQGMGMLDTNRKKTASMNVAVDYVIYPTEGYIPFCSTCMSEYQKVADEYRFARDNPSAMAPDTIEMTHERCGCLCADYFKAKLRKLNPHICIVRDSGRGRSHSARNGSDKKGNNKGK
jgi:hypothetical protein